MQALWLLIPEEAYVLMSAGAGFAIMVGILSPARGLSFVGLVCLIALLTPFMSSIIEYLPDWALLILGAWFVFSLIQAVFGKRVMEKVISMFLFQLLLFPFRLVIRMVGLGGRRR